MHYLEKFVEILPYSRIANENKVEFRIFVE